MMVKAMSPMEIAETKKGLLPDGVIEVWNTLIATRYTGTGSVTVRQEEAIAALLPMTPNRDSRQHIFDNGWLDIEPIFRAAGWYVFYDKPGYNESYEADYTFRAAS